MSGDPRLARSRRELDASRHLVRGGYAAEAISRAYYAAFHAAKVALEALGETRSKHSAVLAAVDQHLIRTGKVPDDVGRTLRSLFDRRGEADYAEGEFTAAAAEEAISRPERVVTVIEEWLRAGPHGGGAPSEGP